MAENEELDLGKSRRWGRVLRAVLDDKPADEVATSVTECLRLSVNALREPAGGRSPQVPLADLLDAVGGDPREVDRIVRCCNGHDFAQLFRDSTVEAKTREAASESFLNAICEKYFDQIEMKAVKTDGHHTFPHVRSRLDQVKALVKPDIERIARQLAADPNSSLRRSRSGAGSEIMPKIPSIDPKYLGRRLAEARKSRRITQQDAADHLQCSRPTLIAIEKGTRVAKAEEIVRLAALYGRTVHELVRAGEPVASLEPHLRAVASKVEPKSKELDEAIGQLQQFAENYRELEELLNAPMTYNYPPEVRLADRVNVVALAEDVAFTERNRLGLGDQPIYHLRRLLESDVGLRIMNGSLLPSHIAGLYAYAGDLGCCILINRKHPAERRRATLVHEYGHVIANRYKPGVDYLNQRGRKPLNERFAERFGMSFLMPATSVRRRFNEIVSATSDFHVADLCRLSHLYYVSVEAMAYRLEGLGLIPGGTIQHLRESRFEVRKAKDILGLPVIPESKDPYPDRYMYLAVQAYEQAKISEGQLARFLGVDPVSAREIVERVSQGINVTDDGKVEGWRFDFQRSLLADI